MLRAILGVLWKEHTTNEELYGKAQPVIESLWMRREEKLYTCESLNMENRKEEGQLKHVHHLRNDIGLQSEEQMTIETEMNGRNLAVAFGSTQNRRKCGLPLFFQFYRR